MPNESDPRYEEIVVAALLHDLGKIAQRAGDDTCPTQGMDGQLLPRTMDGRYTHQHAWYTHGAILKIFEKNSNFPDVLRPEVVARIGASHHNPGSWAEWIIAESDRISSGADRLEKNIAEENKGSFIEQAQLSIFSSIKLHSQQQNLAQRYYRASPLTDAAVNPFDKAKNSRDTYANIWAGLLNDLRSIKATRFDHYLSALDAALEHWTWAIPSSTVNLPDISLYDHARTTAGFSSVLFRYHEANGTIRDSMAIANRAENKFLLVMGDISGIQQYLYDLKTTKHSTKVLRARSFEIRAVTESAVRIIISDFALNQFCVMSSAGGRFFMVLPCIKNADQKLDHLRETIDIEFLKRYLGSLSLSISDALPACFNDFLIDNGSFESTFRKLQRLSGESKFRKLRKGLSKTGHVLDFYYSAIEKTIQNGGRVCPMCDSRPADDQDDFCVHCKELIDCGTKLPKASYIGFPRSEGYGFHLLSDERVEMLEDLEKSMPETEKAGFSSVNNYFPGKGIYRLPYTVPRREDGSVKEFNEIAESAEGIQRLAMFKADLDNLGSIFSQGLAERLSISRYATLSRMLDYFFSVKVRQIIEQSYRNIYTVYSGGDDLCVIGPWNEVIDFAIQVRKEFSAFVADNPDLTISAGIALIGDGLPVSRMADAAEEELENAKNLPQKNCISFLGLTANWDTFEQLILHAKDMAAWLRKKIVSTSTVYNLISLSERAEKFEKGDIRKENALWKSHFLYNLRRTEKREGLPESVIDILKNFAVNAGQMKLARITATYALYANRESRKRKEEVK